MSTPPLRKPFTLATSRLSPRRRSDVGDGFQSEKQGSREIYVFGTPVDHQDDRSYYHSWPLIEPARKREIAC